MDYYLRRKVQSEPVDSMWQTPTAMCQTIRKEVVVEPRRAESDGLTDQKGYKVLSMQMHSKSRTIRQAVLGGWMAEQKGRIRAVCENSDLAETEATSG
jgi:hypothetical protein